MLYGSRISKRKVFHYGDCLYAKRIAFKNKTCFESVEEANSHGYIQCPCCSRIPAEYRKNRKSIQTFCSKYRMKLVLMDDELYVISKDDRLDDCLSENVRIGARFLSWFLPVLS